MAPREIEVKIKVSTFDPIRRRLKDLGAAFVSDENEDNQYFERFGTPRQEESLRLRRDREVRLTWKGPSEFHDGIVQREEIEVQISDFDAMRDILERLDFVVADRIAKRRETWKVSDIVIALDQLEFGTFVELEGAANGVRELAVQLGLNPDDGIPHSYRRLQRDYYDRAAESSNKPGA